METSPPRPPRTADKSPGRRVAATPPGDRLLRSGLKVKHLLLLVALDDHRKLHRAAEAMNLSQPAASKMLGEIEKMVGAAMFERLPRGIEPTRYGEALIRRSRTVLAELGQAGTEITALRVGEGGAVAIGTVMSPAAEIMVDAIERVRARMPRVQITVQVDTSDVLAGHLTASRLDFMIGRIPPGVDPSPFVYREIREETAALLVRAEHPLAGRAAVRPEDLYDRDWVMQARGSLLRRSLEALLRRHGVPPPVRVIDTPSVMMATLLVARTDSILPVAEPVADLFLAAGRFVKLSLTEKLTVEPYGLIRIAGRPLSPAAAAFYATLEDLVWGLPAPVEGEPAA
ncbi:LysR family transcriptional regulator [Oharaeibacter diazotrophicus]|uniref:DNA-binding transcriptional LysR family regulator n=1 Tax=Oharaeibacter diazotrophicus TaxID=1920512 RepID=A0A4V3CWR2_9HYPH|nr:LysR family transcriptional regulator [Oharaeibacter diazotrophicus]TDP87368.1 DNA-binding transcriptional LysR family regulator [Oharaeibacter diazotrophicus]BBE70688.1 HTH-type transcriptional regulator GbpR [Pleomorphomonas sp. SM30]GLS77436.1 LysR family transcriptional regulator [Oharaeibacter diazotrophicus]